MTYPTTFSQKLLLCLILRTEVERVRGRATTFWSGHGVTISGNMEAVMS